MQSLKIIIFRDTDKPYTMIISSRVLVGIAFSLIALMSLFTFSVMSNVMFYRNGGPQPVMLASANEQQNSSLEENQQAENQPVEDESGNNEEVSGEETEYPTTTDDYEENAAENPAEDDSAEQTADQREEIPVETEDNRPEPEYSNTTNNSRNTLSDITPYMPEDSEVEAFLLQDAQLGSNSIRVRVQVQKRSNLGERYRGRFCAALVDNEGNIGPTYPNQVTIEGNDVLNPDKANTFRIAYRRNYEISFPGVDPQNFSAIVFYLYDEQTKTLQWRNSVPLTR